MAASDTAPHVAAPGPERRDAATVSGDVAIAPSNAFRTMLRLVRALFTYGRRDALIVIFLSLAVTLTSGIGLVLLVPLLGVAGLDVGGGSIGQLARVATDVLAALGLEMTLPVVITAFLVVITLGAGLQRWHALHTARLYHGFVVTTRLRVHAAITHSCWTTFVRRPSSSFVHVLTQEVERMGAATSSLIGFGISCAMTAIYVALALFLSPLATLLVIGCGGVLMALLAGKTRLGRAKGDAVSSAYAGLHSAIAEHLAGMRVSKSHGLEPFHLERFGERIGRTAEAQVGIVRNRAAVGFWMQVGSASIMASVFVFALTALALPLASILLMLFLFSRLVPMLSGLQRQLQQILTMLPSVDRVEQLTAALEADAEHGVTGDVDVPAPALRDALVFEGVEFRYDPPAASAEADLAAVDAPPSVLRGVDLTIAAGRTTAIVGPSGAGKSTVADLAVGLLRPTAGRIRLDGVDLDGERVHAWRRSLGYVNQETFLFNETIRDNLLLVRPGASVEELRRALADASATFVDALPDGLDTVVGDRGARLSGGERQRIALARALLRRPTLLVLDEATSALDPENERVIQAAIERVAGTLTILVIAHRLASVRSADAIYVVEDGRVVESGQWDALVRRPNGRLRALCVAQGLVQPAVEDGRGSAPDVSGGR